MIYPEVQAIIDGLDAKTLAGIARYAGTAWAETKTLTIEVFDFSGGEQWTVEQFQTMVNRLVAGIPPEHMATAQVHLEGGYDETTSLKMTYCRPQTWQEVVAEANDTIGMFTLSRNQELARAKATLAAYGE